MPSRIPTKSSSYSWALISVAILMQANSGVAAEPAVDPQTQARDLLSGTVGGLPRVFHESSLVPMDDHTSNLDPQGQARQLILGTPAVRGNTGRMLGVKPAVAKTALPRDHRTYTDPQDAARRMILGSRTDKIGAPTLTPSASLTQDHVATGLN